MKPIVKITLGYLSRWIFGTVFLGIVVFAQPTDEWTYLSADDNKLRISVPGSFLAHREPQRVRVFANVGATSFSLMSEKTNDGRKWVKNLEYPKKNSTSDESLKFGEIVVRRFGYNTGYSYSEAIYIGTAKRYFIITGAAKSADNPDLKRFLASIQIGGLPLLGTTAGEPNSSASLTEISTLDTSQIIVDALKFKSAKPAISFGNVDPENRTYDTYYSRPLIIVSKQKAIYTDEARRSNKQGTIRARVEFLRNGQIGAVVIDSRLDRGLAENVAKVVNQIKFVPAEIDGKPVDVVQVLEYSFAIY